MEGSRLELGRKAERLLWTRRKEKGWLGPRLVTGEEGRSEQIGENPEENGWGLMMG